MGPPFEWVIENDHIAIVEWDALYSSLHGKGHRTQVRWDVCCLSHHVSIFVENGTRTISSLLDIGRERGPGQSHPHLFRDGRKPVLKDL